jgi:hypothetical protein
MLEQVDSASAPQARDVIVSDLLSAPAELSLIALKARSWVAVPVQDNITPKQARGISKAAVSLFSQTALATTTYPSAQPEVWRLALTPTDILSFDANCMLRSFLLVPEN